jgi:sulfoxide reductase heme-binding subunit YedZ
MASRTNAMAAGRDGFLRAVGRRGLKPLVFLVCLIPLALLLADASQGRLPKKPEEFVVQYLGGWALKFLLLTLAVTPIRLISGWNKIAQVRRMLGLFVFAYAVLHILAYCVIEQGSDLKLLWRDLTLRPYIMTGILTFAILLPLAVTSSSAMVRWLGGARWRKLHRLVYAAAIAAVVHFFFMVKGDALFQTFVYGLALCVTLGARIAFRAATENTSGSAGSAFDPRKPMSLN